MSVSKYFLNQIDKLMELSDEPCNGELQCKHCYANQYLNDLQRLLDDWIQKIETDCK
jgi:hypothetical protein